MTDLISLSPLRVLLHDPLVSIAAEETDIGIDIISL